MLRPVCILLLVSLLLASSSALAQSSYGPLSISEPIVETSHRERNAAEERNDARHIDEPSARAELAAMGSLFETLLEGAELADARHHLAQNASHLSSISPQSVERHAGMLRYISERVGVCVRAPGVMRHCDVYWAAPPSHSGPPYSISIDGGLATLTIHDLSEGAAGWQSFATDSQQLSSARAIVIDVRNARGTDPRPLIPWLESITGRSPLAPLREIRRPQALRAYADAYRARFRTETRNDAAWQSLVGSASTSIALRVGAHGSRSRDDAAPGADLQSRSPCERGAGRSLPPERCRARLDRGPVAPRAERRDPIDLPELQSTRRAVPWHRRPGLRISPRERGIG